jgi:flagellin
MSISLQTNVDSLVAQQNLSTNSAFESKTIQQLTSGYRINSSADDAAGLAIANGFRSSEAELTQGVQNANNGISTLQIVDGGMNNISQMLDTLRTLATQSASGTFTGDRGVLNNQFQSLLTEVDRESQSIGLNTGGEFQKSLSVYIGGGTNSTGSFSTGNGTVNIDLTGSAVDTQALGLKGMQVVAGSTDLSSASATSVANIVGNTSNTTAISGYSEFDFAGPGFSDGSQAKVSVNLSGVTDMNTLVSAINNGIQAAGNGSTAASTAFKNAGIVASVHTDANGGQELAFTSSSTAFQVGAGDQMANALMGNFSSGSTGTAISSTVTGGSTTAGAITSPTDVAFQISGGGLTSPVTLNLTSGSTTTAAAITDITSQVANNSSLKAAGITVSGSAGSPLVFTDSYGNKMNVEVTGDTTNALGFGSFVAGATPTNANYSTITGAGFSTSTALGTAQLGFSINGGASTGANLLSVSLSGGDATAATESGSGYTAPTAASTTGSTYTAPSGATGDDLVINGISVAIAQNATVQTAVDDINNTSGTGVTASVSGGHIKLTATGGTNGTFTLANGVHGAALTDFGLPATFGASNLGDDLNISLDGAPATAVNIAQGSTVTQAATAINTAAAGVTATVNSSGFLVLTANSAGAHAITLTNGTNGAALTDFGLGASFSGTSRTAQSVADALNSGISASSSLTAAGLKATVSTGQLVLTSSNGTSFRVNAGGSGTAANVGFGVAGATYAGATVGNAGSTFVDANGVSNTGAVTFGPMQYGGDTQAITISANNSSGGLQSKTITLQNNATAQTGQSIDSAISSINQQLQQSDNPTLQSISAVKEDVGGTEKINFISSLNDFSVSFGSSPNGDGFSGDAGTTVASTQNGSAATVSIDTQAGALQAVAAVATAVTKLGVAQAGVGEGQNQLNYAVGLAQSQVTNFSAAESRIRDADVAKEAANLTKSQTLQQASIAAMAQANTEPQAILSLLHG